MAKVVEKNVVVKMSVLAKDDSNKDIEVPDEVLSTLEEVVGELMPGTIVEVYKD